MGGEDPEGNYPVPSRDSLFVRSEGPFAAAVHIKNIRSGVFLTDRTNALFLFGNHDVKVFDCSCSHNTTRGLKEKGEIGGFVNFRSTRGRPRVP